MTGVRCLPTCAMVLAAGRGKRMSPLSDTRPKPLLKICGKPLIDHVLDQLADIGVRDAVVNLHYLGDQIEAHLKTRNAPRVSFSREHELLETGGGVRNALAKLGKDPFFVVNADTIWLDGRTPALRRLADGWNGKQMDALLLLYPIVSASRFEGRGDFLLDQAGRVRRPHEREVAPFVFTGVQILDPQLLVDAPEGCFSLNLLYDLAAERSRLFGIRHDGEWFHVGTPRALQETNEAIQQLSGRGAET